MGNDVIDDGRLGDPASQFAEPAKRFMAKLAEP
jgi:hypothetical protein